MIPAGHLERMREAQSRLLVEAAAAHQVRTTVANGRGGTLEQWTPQAGRVDARLVLASEADRREARGRVTVDFTWTVTLNVDTTVKVGDRLDFDGRLVQIAGVISGGTLETARRYAAFEVH